MRSGKASIATGTIERFTPAGIHLESGEEIRADIIVAATGLNMQMLGGVEISTDGEPVRAEDRLIYKGMMLSDVPNLFIAFGYTNASWTLRSDLTARSVCRLLNHMDRARAGRCVARAQADVEPRPIMDLTSGYVKRAEAMLPKQGDREPWRVPQNYVRDLIGMTFGYNSGYAINPARDLGPRLFTAIAGWGSDVFRAGNDWWWVPIVGPLLGGVLGGVVYDLFVTNRR